VAADGLSAFWRDRPTLVTGGTGLVGGAVLRRLLDGGASVVALVRDWVPESELVSTMLDRVTVVRGDVRDQELLERVLGEYEVDTVLHLAAQTIVPIAYRNPVSTWSTNVAGTWALLEACRRSPLVAQIVVASSDKAYGDAGEQPYDESTPLAGRHPYDASKAAADLIAQSYAATYDLPVAITRCGNFYGPGDLNWNRLVPGTIRSVVRGTPPVIRSDGTSVRDYFYVDDGAAAYVLLAEKLAADPSLRGEAFNFSLESPLTVVELVRKILDSMESTLEAEVRDEAPHEIRYQALAAGKARSVLGWSPLYTLDEGLALTIPWYVDHLERAR
jgi:CDP-glucose 4,6-dehydratase